MAGFAVGKSDSAGSNSAGRSGLRAVRIGSSLSVFPAGLSPMAGYTDSAMRSMCLEFGAGLAMTEVANAEALSRGSKPTVHLLYSVPGERPLGAHIYGSKPEAMAAAAARAESLGRFDFIDINAGCPVRKIMAKGAGAALMGNPSLIEFIIKTVSKSVSLPVTIKTRIGLDPGSQNVLDILDAAEQGGAAAIFIHARFASNKHSGPANWDLLAKAKAAASIPVFGNGGIENADDFFRMVRDTGVDGAIIGRAAVGHPWIFQEIRNIAAGKDAGLSDLCMIKKVALEQFERIIRLKQVEYAHRKRSSYTAEQAAAMQFRGHLARYLSGKPGWPAVRRVLQNIKSKADIESCIDTALGAS